MKNQSIIDNILKTKWTPKLVSKYIGQYLDTFLVYANDEAVRNNAASGGFVTALLGNMLTTRTIDGVVCLRSKIDNEMIEPEYFIAQTPRELFQAQGSKYISTKFTSKALPLIRDFSGKLAVVTLPCDSNILERYCQKNPIVKEKIVLVITLFCGHSTQKELTQRLVDKLRPNHNAKLTDFRYRSGHWRGMLTAAFDQQLIVQKPFSYFSDYQNLYFFCEPKCLHCYDHTGYRSDISVGDIWLQKMKDNPIKHSAIIVRSEFGLACIKTAERLGALHIEPVSIGEICDGQSRSLKPHYNLTARSRVGKLFNLTIHDTVKEKVYWQDYAIALIILLNYRISQGKLGRKILFLIPRPLLKIYLYFLKALESL